MKKKVTRKSHVRVKRVLIDKDTIGIKVTPVKASTVTKKRK